MTKEELEKENAELKIDLEELTISDNSQRVISNKNEQISFLETQLAEAKKLIRNLLYVYQLGKNELATARVRAEAEQFLSEVE